MLIRIKGDVDIDNFESVRARILSALNDSDEVDVDLSKVDFIDSSGLSCLIEGVQTSYQRNKTFRLVNPSPAVERVLDISALKSVFEIAVVEQQLADESQQGEGGADNDPFASFGGALDDFDDMSFDELGKLLDEDLDDFGLSGVKLEDLEEPEHQTAAPVAPVAPVVEPPPIEEEILLIDDADLLPTMEDVLLEEAKPSAVQPEQKRESNSGRDLNNINLHSAPASGLFDQEIEDYDDDPLNRL